MDDKRKSPLNRILTTLAHGSGPFITTFVLIHLSAPILANVGGSSLASSTMLLGREYYQTDFGEKALVLGPITLHILSATLKRLLSPKPAEEPRRWSSPLTVTGYVVSFLFLPIHYLTHRVYPSEEAAPILAIGPSELDYEFVKHGLRKWPTRSWILYGGLVFFTSLHLASGVTIIWNAWTKDLFPKLEMPSRKTMNRLVLGSIMVPVLASLFLLSKEPPMTLSSTAERFTAAFTTSLVYRL